MPLSENIRNKTVEFLVYKEWKNSKKDLFAEKKGVIEIGHNPRDPIWFTWLGRLGTAVFHAVLCLFVFLGGKSVPEKYVPFILFETKPLKTETSENVFKGGESEPFLIKEKVFKKIVQKMQIAEHSGTFQNENNGASRPIQEIATEPNPSDIDSSSKAKERAVNTVDASFSSREIRQPTIKIADSFTEGIGMSVREKVVRTSDQYAINREAIGGSARTVRGQNNEENSGGRNAGGLGSTGGKVTRTPTLDSSERKISGSSVGKTGMGGTQKNEGEIVNSTPLPVAYKAIEDLGVDKALVFNASKFISKGYRCVVTIDDGRKIVVKNEGNDLNIRPRSGGLDKVTAEKALTQIISLGECR